MTEQFNSQKIDNEPAGAVKQAGSVPSTSDLQIGQQVVTAEIEFSRADLVRYAGASGDFNTIHWNERFAKEVGLDGVIAHGMLTMGAVIAPVVEWAGDPGAVLDYKTRFTAPVVVPDADSGSPEQPTAFLRIVGTVGAIDDEKKTVRIDLDVTDGQTNVMGRTQAEVRVK